jgi:hypothetical protein
LERGTKEIWDFGEPTVALSVILADAAARRNETSSETPNLPDDMNRSCHLPKLERVAAKRWCDRLVGLVALRSGHDPG